MDKIIYHITEEKYFESQKQTGEYFSPTFTEEGFIHLSTKKVRTHSYVLTGTEFKLTTNYSGVVETTVYPNLSYQNDTVYWNYNQQVTKSVLLVKK